MRVIVFDTETTGLPSTKTITSTNLHMWPHILQFSYVIYDTVLNSIIEIKDSVVRVDDDIKISKESTNIHGITNQMCEEIGVSIFTILDEFFYYLKDCDMLIGHNISFDLNMIEVELMRIICDKRNDHNNNNDNENEKIKSAMDFKQKLSNYKNIYCTLNESIQLCNIQAVSKYGKTYLKFPKLSELHVKLFDSEPKNLHNSLNDVLITLRCYMKIEYDIDLLEESNSFKVIAIKNKLI